MSFQQGQQVNSLCLLTLNAVPCQGTVRRRAVTPSFVPARELKEPGGHGPCVGVMMNAPTQLLHGRGRR